MAVQPPSQGAPPVDPTQVNADKANEEKRLRDKMAQEAQASNQALNRMNARSTVIYPRQAAETDEQFVARLNTVKQTFINALPPEIKKDILSEKETESSIVVTKAGLVFTGENGMTALREYLKTDPTATVKIFGKDEASAKAELLRYVNHGIDIHKVTELSYQDASGKTIAVTGPELDKIKAETFKSLGQELPAAVPVMPVAPAVTPTAASVPSRAEILAKVSPAKPDVSEPSLGTGPEVPAPTQVQAPATPVSSSIESPIVENKPVEKPVEGEKAKAAVAPEPKTKPQPFVDTPELELEREISSLKNSIYNSEWVVKEKTHLEEQGRKGEGPPYNYDIGTRMSDEARITADQNRLKQAEAELVALRASSKATPTDSAAPTSATPVTAAATPTPATATASDTVAAKSTPVASQPAAPVNLNVTQAQGPYLPNNVVEKPTDIQQGLKPPTQDLAALSMDAASQLPPSPNAKPGEGSEITPQFDTAKELEARERKAVQDLQAAEAARLAEPVSTPRPGPSNKSA